MDGTGESGFDPPPGRAFVARANAALHLQAEGAPHQAASGRLVMHDEEGGLGVLGLSLIHI